MRLFTFFLLTLSLFAEDKVPRETRISFSPRFSMLTSHYTDANGIEFVYIPPGTFTIGDNDYGPPHKVTLTNGFYMGKFEVTQTQWRKVMGADPPQLNFKGCDQCPVENVSWNDVQAFIQKLNASLSISGSQAKYRLPTEAEWEYAARAGSTTKYYWGEEAYGEYAWYSDNSESKTHPVGTRKPNAFGLYDMSGNVWEWCSDWYDSNEYEKRKKMGDVVNPKGPGTGDYRVLRGGSWNLNDNYMRSSIRVNNSPNVRNNYIGFRLLLSISE